MPENYPDPLRTHTNVVSNGQDAADNLPLLDVLAAESREKAATESEAASSQPLPLHDRIRRETDGFEFSALIGGVSTIDKPPAQPPLRIVVPTPPARKSKRGRMWLGASVGILAIAGVTAALMLRGNGPTANSTPTAAGRQAVALAEAPPRPLTTAECLKKGLPDPKITPGERGPIGEGPEKVSPEIAEKVFAAYGIPGQESRYTLNRLIPRSLGGTANPANLYPSTPWFRDLKKRLDKRLAQMVRAGEITIEQAEADLKDNWVMAVHKYYVRNYGSADEQKAKEIEETVPWSQRPAPK